jgi:NADPH-dependent curcumin reductase CurA
MTEWAFVMKEGVNRQILLVDKPSGKLGPEHFRLVEGAMPKPIDGEVLLRVRYISLDAANRAWMHGATYRRRWRPTPSWPAEASPR